MSAHLSVETWDKLVALAHYGRQIPTSMLVRQLIEKHLDEHKAEVDEALVKLAEGRRTHPYHW